MDQPQIITPLNPADYFTLAMDEEIRRDGMPGSYGCYGLQLSSRPDPVLLAARIDEFCYRFPEAKACLRQIGKRYYWCQRKIEPQLFSHYHDVTDVDEATFHRRQIEAVMNQHEPRQESLAVSFHLIETANRFTFFLRWLHPFCDAKGAHLILKYLCSDDQAQRQLFGADNGSLVAQQLAKFPWWKKIYLFFKAKQHIKQLDKSLSILPVTPKTKPERLGFQISRLTTDQTRLVSQQARVAVGLTGTSLYYIGCFMRALSKLGTTTDGESYCTPYAFNLRKQRALSPMTGNHLSALFAQAPKSIVVDRAQLFAYLKQQNAATIRRQIDYAYLTLMWAGSWLALDRYGKILRESGTHFQERSSFWFSDIGQLDLEKQTLSGGEIEDVFHISHVTAPPGLAFLCSVFKQRLTVSYSFVEPDIDASWIDQLHQLFVAELLAESL